MADYTRQILSARRRVERKGQLIQYRRFVVDLVSEPWLAHGQSTGNNLSLYIVFTPAGQQTKYRAGTLVGKGGYTGLMADHGFEPSLKDRVLRGNELLSIRDVISIKINEQAIYHQIAFDR